MENVDILIRAREPEIDAKCAEIKQKKSEKLLTYVFMAVAALLLIVPALLIFFGVSVFTVFVPIVFVGVTFLAATPILISKGVKCYE